MSDSQSKSSVRSRAVLTCSECETLADNDDLFCLACGGLLSFAIESPFEAREWREILADRRTSNDHIDTSGVWRYREFLPAVPLDAITTLRENAVPIYGGPAGAVYAGVDALSYLHLGMNPTASFKDAGMTVAISHAKARGAKVAVCASTGNTAAAMAAYAARAGLTAVVLVPALGVSAAKLAQTLDYGARVVAIDGDFDRALEIVRTLDSKRIAIVNSVNPYRIEGQKTGAFQLLEQRGWRVPDWIILPGGNLGNTTAFGKGFREALAVGLIDRLPRIAVVQAAGAAPFVPVVRTGSELVPVKADTNATAIMIGAPASWRKALREVQVANGTARSVTDAEIADARAIVGRDGVGCEPASAASLAGLKQLRAEGVITQGEDVVLVLTGHVLKDGNYAAEYHESKAEFANKPQSFASPEAVADYIDELALGRAS
jgi:threonine synthase